MPVPAPAITSNYRHPGSVRPPRFHRRVTTSCRALGYTLAMRTMWRLVLALGLGASMLAAGGPWQPGGAAGTLVAVGQPAPEITGGPWINSEPLSLSGLKGRVVLVEFWTYG